MAITFVNDSISLTLDNGNAQPKLSIGKEVAVIHLTHGFTTPELPKISYKDAVTIGGRVLVRTSTEEQGSIVRNKWKFGFIQVIKNSRIAFTWSGRRDSEGETKLVLTDAPAWPQDKITCLDGTGQNIPFMNRGLGLSSQREDDLLLTEATNDMGDHPALKVSLRHNNSVTKAPNFLRIMERNMEVHSVFVAREPSGAFHHLAFVKWIWNATADVKWTKGKADEDRSKLHSIFFFLRQQPGAPPDGDVLQILADPHEPIANEVGDKAVPLAFANPINLKEAKTRDSDIPKDWFTN